MYCQPRIRTWANHLPLYAPRGLPCVPQPADCPKYVIPGSQWLDPPYSHQMQQNSNAPRWFGCWPYPRKPLKFETETRAKGTGLLGSCVPTWLPPPPPCPPCPPYRR